MWLWNHMIKYLFKNNFPFFLPYCPSFFPFFILHIFISADFALIESESHEVISNSLQPHGLYSPWNSLGQNTGVASSLSLLHRIFSTQGSIPGLLHCRWILYQLSNKWSPRNGVDSLSFLQRIFQTQELNWGLLHFR